MDKIVCFGKNYQDHMLELGDEPVLKPVIFLKPPSVLKQCSNWGGKIDALLTENETHYECELVIKLAKGGYRMTTNEARSVIGAYTVGLDMTLRKEQAILKAKGHPWTTSKVFPDACIIGPWINIINTGNIANTSNTYNVASNIDMLPNTEFMDLEFKFTLDNNLKQKSFGSNMLFNPVDLIVLASNFFPLCVGDILFTGTPSGVGTVNNHSIGVLAISEYQYTVEWNSELKG
jgi:2-keto-4-pentenoate hydratase/2-oxohepta-3-ene-1,7-dioic acid hydratase in catechol pathway